jgi:hypothetical protein
MAAFPSTSELYSQAASGLDKYINPDSLVNTIQVAVNAYMPAVYAIGFLLLTAGTMREFLSAETKRFFGTLLRAILLVACMSGAPTLIGWFENAADALAQIPAGVSFSINGTSYSLTGAQSPSLTQLESALQSKVQGGGNANAPGNSQSYSGPFDFLGSAGNAVKSFLSNAEHLAWEILFAIFLLWLLLCKVVVILMLFIQKVVVIGFNLLYPDCNRGVRSPVSKDQGRQFFPHICRRAHMAGGMESRECGYDGDPEVGSDSGKPELCDALGRNRGSDSGVSLDPDRLCSGADLRTKSCHSRRGGGPRIRRNDDVRGGTELGGGDWECFGSSCSSARS